MRSAVLALVLVLSACLAPLAASTARAQDAATGPAATDPVATEAPAEPTSEPAAETSRARQLFEQGLEAAEEGRWADALPLFEESYALSNELAALYNLGATLRALGRHVESRDALRRLLADPRPIAPELRTEVEAMLADEESRVAVLSVEGGDAIDSLSLRLDARPIETPSAWPLELSLDPGAHVLEASAEGRVDQRWEGRLASGDRQTVVLDLPLVPRGEEVWESPWFWVIVGSVVVGGAVAGAVIAQEEAQLDPRGQGFVLRL